MTDTKIAFIGAGRMAGAMIGGLLKQNVFSARDIICTSANDGTGEKLAADLGIVFTLDPEELLEGATTVVLACKPQQLDSLDPRIAQGCEGKRILSILAGVTAERLRQAIPSARCIIRSMPNTPGLVGAGVTVYAPPADFTAEDRVAVDAVLRALGDVFTAREEDLDAVTAVSGSGPAYVFEMVAAMRDAGIAEGLEEALAYKLALKTVFGAAKLLEAVPETPETHRNWVSSPGGTTLAGLAVMEKSGFREIIKKTVEAAAKRSRELAGGS